MTRRLPPLAAALVVASALGAPAFAAPATQAGADRIAAAFKAYFGPAARAATITPQGDSYALTLNPAPIFAQAAGAGVTGTFTPLAFTLTDEGDGQWSVALDQPVNAALDLPNSLHAQYDIARYQLSARFSEALMAFTQVSADATGVSVDETITPAGAPQTHVVIGIDAAHGESTGTTNPGGGVDLALQVHGTGLTESITRAPAEGKPAFPPITATAKALSEQAHIAGLRTRAVLDILAWIVAHPDKAAKDAAKAQVKPLIDAALPVFTDMGATAEISGVALGTPIGPAALDRLSVTFELNGLVPDGKLREAFSVQGPSLPPGIVPAWAEPLVPQSVTLDGQVTGYDAAGLITVALSALELPAEQTKGPAFDARMQAAFLPKGTVTLTLNPSAVQGRDYKIAAQGSMDAGPDTTVPTGQAKITLSGLEAIRNALVEAPQHQGSQALLMLGAITGLAKSDADGTLNWNIDATTPGKVLVNGMDVSQMGGGQ